MPKRLDQILEELGAPANLTDPVAWFQSHIRLRGKPWALDGHEYLRAIVEDPAEHIVIEKAAQLGISTAVIGRMILACLTGLKAGYFLESRGYMTTFVQDRFDPIITADKRLARAVVEGEYQVEDLAGRHKRADSVRLKHIGPGSAYFCVTQKRSDVKNVDLDLVILDEVAELNAELVDWVDDRLLHSGYKRRYEVSQPDVPNWGIDERFRLSDQKYWALRCPRCRLRTAVELEFPACLEWVDGKRRISAGDFILDETCRGLTTDNFRLVCPRCHARLDPEAGEWITRNLGARISGYHLSQLYGPAIDAPAIARKWIAAQSRPSRMANFYISILGLPYAGDRQPLTEELLAEHCGGWRPSPSGTTENLPSGAAFAGIDVGDVCHLVIVRRGDDGVFRLVWGEATGSWQLLERRLHDYDVRMVVVDAMPYKTSAKALVRAFKRGAISYMSAQSTRYSIEDGETDPVHVINCDRTEATDALVDAMTAGDLWLPRSSELLTASIKAHLKNLIKDKNADGSMTYKRGLDDHYAQALIRALLAAGGSKALGMGPCEHLGDSRSWRVGRSIVPTKW
jgi:hypothetical protein